MKHQTAFPWLFLLPGAVGLLINQEILKMEKKPIPR